MGEIVISTREALAPGRRPLEENPAAIYLASLAPGSRRTMEHALDTIAGLLGFSSWRLVPWAALRFQHTSALRSALMERYAASTTNKMLSALRGALKAANRLGLIDANEYGRAIDLPPVAGERPDAAAGRALSMGEIGALMASCSADPGRCPGRGPLCGGSLGLAPR